MRLLLPPMYGFGGERETWGIVLCSLLLVEIEDSGEVRFCIKFRCWRGSEIGGEYLSTPGRRIEGTAASVDGATCGCEYDLRSRVFRAAPARTVSSASRSDKGPFFLIGGTA